MQGQLDLERCGFELCRSSYMHVFSFDMHSSNLSCSRVNWQLGIPVYWRTNLSYAQILDCLASWGLTSLSSSSRVVGALIHPFPIVQGSNVIWMKKRLWSEFTDYLTDASSVGPEVTLLLNSKYSIVVTPRLHFSTLSSLWWALIIALLGHLWKDSCWWLGTVSHSYTAGHAQTWTPGGNRK